jgi:hypothetical protein
LELKTTHKHNKGPKNKKTFAKLGKYNVKGSESV